MRDVHEQDCGGAGVNFLGRFPAELHDFVRRQFRGAVRSGATNPKIVVLHVNRRAKSALASPFVIAEDAKRFKALIDTTQRFWSEAVGYAAEIMSERPSGVQLNMEFS